jgi:hypothetical protein
MILHIYKPYNFDFGTLFKNQVGPIVQFHIYIYIYYTLLNIEVYIGMKFYNKLNMGIFKNFRFVRSWKIVAEFLRLRMAV